MEGNMNRISVIYWSASGNTEEMAKLIAQGAREKGSEVKFLQVSKATLEDVKAADVVVLGSPAMGGEVIEETEMDPFVESIKDIVVGKLVALFGSYGWGSGEWMTSWVARMDNYGANVIGSGLIVNEFPQGEDANNCIEFGKELAEKSL
jgi:flavodoxin short chain